MHQTVRNKLLTMQESVNYCCANEHILKANRPALIATETQQQRLSKRRTRRDQQRQLKMTCLSWCLWNMVTVSTTTKQVL